MKLGERLSQEAYRFGGRTYTVGQSYGFRDLPAAVQRDIVKQEEEIAVRYGMPPEATHYRFIIVPHDELIRLLKEVFGEREYEKRLRDSATREFAHRIDQEGLQHPPVLDEGWRRAFALAYLGWDMPYFVMDEPIEMPEFVNIPTLDGRRRSF